MVALTAVTTGSARAGSPPAPAGASDPAGTTLLVESFKNATAPEFTGFNEACLTGAPPGAPTPGPHQLGGCEPAEVGPVPPNDAAPLGYLRLSDARRDESAAALYNHPLPANEGLDITFQTWQYGSTTPTSPADGISFFLTNGDVNLTSPGAFGGSLGYAKKLPFADPSVAFIPGVADGYIGVGLDVLGNYFADTEQRGYSCEHSPSPAGPPTSDATYYERGPNMVTLRGPGNGIDGYCYITATTDFPHSQPPGKPWPSNLPGQLQGSLRYFSTTPVTPESAQTELEPDTRTVNVRLTPAPHPRLIVSVDFSNGTGPHQVLDVPAPEPVPETYKFGFASSTGDFTDIHLVRNVVIATDEPLPRLNLVKQVAEPRPGNLVEGDQVTYEYVLTNGGDVPITHLAVDDPVVGPVKCPDTTLEVGGESVTCHATYTIKAADVARGHIANTAVAAGEASGRPVTSPPAHDLLELTLPPSLDLEKLVDTPPPYHAGQTVTYRYLVTNTGGVTVTGLHISDDHVTDITCAASSIAPAGRAGDSTTCHGSYVITSADAFDGQVTNTAVAAGTADGHPVSSPEAAATLLIGPPRLTIAKRVVTPGPYFPGTAVRYSYLVTNTGPRPLHDVVVQDGTVPHVVCDITTLAPGESTTCHGTYMINPADALVRHVTNLAQAFGIEPNGDFVQSSLVSRTIRVSTPTPVTG